MHITIDGPPAYTEINPSAPPPVVQQQAVSCLNVHFIQRKVCLAV